MNPPTPRTFLAVPCVIVATFVAAVSAIFAALIAPRSRAVDEITRLWAKVIAWSCGLRLRAEGMEHVPRGRTCVVVSNHQSHLDVVALVLSSPLPLRMLGKKSLFKIPFFGWALTLAGHVPIDRRKGKTDFDALRKSCEMLLRLGRSVMVFPEGHRGRDASLRPFKSGAFHIARNLGVPIVPVGIRGTTALLPAKTLRFRGGEVLIRWHEPIESGDHSADDLMDRTRKIIADDLA